MKHSNISIFVAHVGCPNKCSFCNQHTISGSQKAPSAHEVRCICTQALSEIKNPENAEIAFFGGSFTAIPRDYMMELLRTAYEFIGEGKFHGIRISTRPDFITPEILEILKKYGVTAIELGAQSMNDDVLRMNERGHAAEDVFRASHLIREYGFELGLQMMVGLYGSTPETENETMNKIIEIKPDTVRIYPVVILKGTRLAELLKSGEYKPFDFDYVVEFSAECLINFEKNNIKVIKCGLHASEFVENDKIGGFYHPAFRELCENIIYRNKISEIIRKMSEIIRPNVKQYIFKVNDKCISKALGHKKSNVEFFRKKGIEIGFIPDSSIPEYEVFWR
ncbi:MAG: radical SAM protein [Prevotella sp.]|nr:radical SAM protein [Alistipes senegalensis]MCM1357415.1 radical SAM protein [Prevotella sp.]